MTGGVKAIVERARERHVFSGAAWSYGTSDEVLGAGTIGTLAWDGAPVNADTWWDLASVTKPIVGLAVMSLIESGELLLDDTVGEHLPDFANSDKATLTVRQLLSHTSGIPGQVPLYRWCDTAAELIEAIRDVPVAFAAGTDVIYSSQGFIVLGLIAQAVSALPLDRLVAERVTTPAGMGSTWFRMPTDLRSEAAATENCPWRGRILQGTVHDENADLLRGGGRPRRTLRPRHRSGLARSGTMPRRCRHQGASAVARRPRVDDRASDRHVALTAQSCLARARQTELPGW